MAVPVAPLPRIIIDLLIFTLIHALTATPRNIGPGQFKQYFQAEFAFSVVFQVQNYFSAYCVQRF